MKPENGQRRLMDKSWRERTEDGYRLVTQEIFSEEESHKWVLLLHGYTGMGKGQCILLPPGTMKEDIM